MSESDEQYDRRSVLKATGAALGAVGMTTAITGSASAERLCLRYDARVYDECPPTSLPTTMVQAGSEAFEHWGCNVGGTQYYYVSDPESEGYVRRWKLEPC